MMSRDVAALRIVAPTIAWGQLDQPSTISGTGLESALLLVLVLH